MKRKKKKVGNRKERDGLNMDRLSSFLQNKGMLDVQVIKKIKDHVFYIESKENAFILKSHDDYRIIDHQWQFFNQMKNIPEVVPFIHFPNGKKVLINKDNDYFTISPFIKGERLTYKKANDRMAAILALRTFHNKATNIYTHQKVKKNLFIHRCYNRLSIFKESRSIFEHFGYMTLFKDIVQTTYVHLQNVSELPWQTYEEKAYKIGSWIHGDVASHNFIKDHATNTTYLIDFDLLAVSSQIYDYIQLGQRYLPYINWNLNQLLAYNMVPEEQNKLWLSALIIPTDVLRDWMYFISKDVNFVDVEQNLAQMEDEWQVRGYFLKKATSMLKLL